MEPLGSFAFVLHTHLPYSRHAGRWPHGEEWLDEAATDTYIPLLEMLSSLGDDVPFAITISLTPVLAEQLAAPEVMADIESYLRDLIRRSQEDQARFERSGDWQQASLAHFYCRWYEARLRAYLDRFAGDIVGAIRRLQEQGRIEVIASAATHAYLPLLSRDSSVYAQVHTGIEAYRARLASAPQGFWLPECAYRPASGAGDAFRPGLEEFLGDHGIRFFFVESNAIEGGAAPTGTGHLAPWYRGTERLAQASPSGRAPVEFRTTSLPYLVGTSDVCVVARNRRLSMQVWSAGSGYPGDGRYREFHKRDAGSGLRYWSVTGSGVGLGDKAYYDPDFASECVLGHAKHFAALVVEELQAHRERYGSPGLATAVFDTELFGHWWFEGIEWLGHVLKLLAREGRVRLQPVAGYLEANPPQQRVDLPACSWGAGGDERTWLNDDTRPIWEGIHAAEATMERLVATASPDKGRFLAQAGRELLLMQSSDWPFLVTTGQAREYAWQRFRDHQERFSLLSRLLQAGGCTADEWAYLERLERLDDLYPFLRPAWFAERQGCARREGTGGRPC